MAGSLDYENLRWKQQKNSLKTEAERTIEAAGKFPNCKGLFPDCPEKPAKSDPACKNCPKIDED